MNPENSYYFITFGCKLNQAETDSLRRRLMRSGSMVVSDIEAADTVILNSCRVTKRAEAKNLKTLRNIKKRYPEKKIILTGCEERTEYEKFAEIVPRKQLEKYFFLNKKIYQKSEPDCPSKTRAFVKIQDGCNNFCAYCIVPLLRGREKSLPETKIIRRIESLERSGCKEVVLVGVNIGKYRHTTDLTGLLRMVLDKTSKVRIRMSSIHPEDINEELIDLMARENRICNHFHLSLQSGSNKILQAMNRHYTREEVLALVEKIRVQVAGIELTTDIIIGFPGETEEDTEETVNLIRQVKFLKVHLFRYSKRQGTAAAELPSQIPPEVKKKRYEKLAQITREVRQEILEAYLGKVVTVLFESSKKGSTSGFTDNYLKVTVPADQSLKNQVRKVKLQSFSDEGFRGKLKPPDNRGF